jgi:hypothetical protein
LCSVRRDDLPLNRTDGQGTRHAREALARSATGWGLAQASHALAWPLTSRRPAALRTRAATAARPSPSPTCSACAPGRPLPPRSQHALPADGPARASSGAPHGRHDDVPRDAFAVLRGAGGGGDAGARVSPRSADGTPSFLGTGTKWLLPITQRARSRNRARRAGPRATLASQAEAPGAAHV